jgi:hypothetical protein
MKIFLKIFFSFSNTYEYIKYMRETNMIMQCKHSLYPKPEDAYSMEHNPNDFLR